MNFIFALLSGLIFGFGLIVSQMTNPAKILNFLDLFGQWDPSLIFVMAGAISVTFLGFKVLKQKGKPLFAEQFDWPTRKDIDARLLTGAALFGLGWGLVGLCPGPAIVGLSLNVQSISTFLIPMILAMSMVKWFVSNR